ncbi:AI-2E family transporter [Actinotalea sp. Marseille-Q4924]|uniref:AI-2E family transporter n=1 Tax=Actinotalea sp. Marseille-Q4924 TaxID=2866571 RepID=UPI001CE47F78|nr:AI-2E family transporter [Actinotalea sp. Marseille-Q4924]
MTVAPGGDAAPERPVLESVPRSVQVAAAWAWRLIVIAIALAVVLLGLSVGKVIWVPVAIALLLTVLLNPLAEWLVRWARMPRVLAAALCVVGLLVVVGSLLTLVGRQLVMGFGELYGQAQEGFSALLVYLADSPLGIDTAQIEAYIDEAQAQLQANSDSLVSGALAVTTTVGSVLAGMIISLFVLLFFLKDGPMIGAWLVRLLPAGARHRTWEASRRGLVTLSSYVRAQILVAFVDAVGIGLGAALLGLPLVVPLTVLVFLASFIPFVGAIATGAIAVLVALVDQGPGAAVIMLLIVLGVQQLEGNVLQPLLLGHAVSLHPVAVLLAVTAGSLTAGILGALLAVPVAATINTVVLYLHGRDKFPRLGRDPDGLDTRLARLGGPPPEPRRPRRGPRRDAQGRPITTGATAAGATVPGRRAGPASEPAPAATAGSDGSTRSGDVR